MVPCRKCGGSYELVRTVVPPTDIESGRVDIEVVCSNCEYKPALGDRTVLRNDVDLWPHRESILEMIASGATQDDIMTTFEVTAWAYMKFITSDEMRADVSLASEMSATQWMDRGFEYLRNANEANKTSVSKAKQLAEHCVHRAKTANAKLYVEKVAAQQVNVNVDVNPFAEALLGLVKRGSAPPIAGEYSVIKGVQIGSPLKCAICNGTGCEVCNGA